MSRIAMSLALSAALLACASHAARSAGPPTTRAATRRGVRVEAKSFDLRAVPPPTPALLYQLAFDPAERKAGSGAAEYLQAAVLLTDAEQALVDHALDADAANDVAAFNKATQSLFADARVMTILDLIDDAGRHETGGLDAVWRDVGVDALLPQLNPMRGLANLLRVRAWQQLRAGDVAGVIGTVRVSYQLARAVGDGGPVICGMVGVGIAAIGDDALARLMGRPDAPNLYWALADAPRPLVSFRRSMDAERRLQVCSFPPLVSARTADAEAGDCDFMVQMSEGMHRGAGHARRPTTRPSAMAQAAVAVYVATHPEVTAYYARRHGIAPAAASKVDPAVQYATYMISGFQDGWDEMGKLLGLPFPVLIPRMADLAAATKKPGLPNGVLFAIMLPSLSRTIDGYAQTERTLSAMTAVEALRSYATAHDGRLPEKLADVTDTPVPDNPVTGKPFEYRLVDGVATLGDHGPLLADRPLEYTVRVRH